MIKKSFSKKMVPYLLLGTILILVDQVTKWVALSTLASRIYSVSSWLTFRLVFNRGVSWGMFNSGETLPFLLVTAGIIIVTTIIAVSAYVGLCNKKPILGQTLVVAGSLANLIDRFVHHAVIDFIQLSYKGWSWPVFNIADCCIVGGVILMIIQQTRNK